MAHPTDTTGRPVRIAVDIGGTFTDVVLERGPHRYTTKVLTTPAAPESGVISAIDDVLQRSSSAPGDVSLIIHGTTLATNAIIERKGARTALVTTEGFRDVLEIGYESRYDQYDLMIDKPVALVPRHLRFTVSERTDVRGRTLVPLDEPALTRIANDLQRLKVESAAIGFLHSYANPGHENRAREQLSALCPNVSFSVSNEVCPEVREYERLSTTVANAYVRPLMHGYLTRLRERLDAMGLGCQLLLMTSGGGLTTLETAMRFPIRLVESGPAGGAILASRVAADMALDKVLSFDMGGTTAKICLIEQFEPRSAREFEVDRAARFTKGSGLPLRIPVIEMVEIGAGGGSIARVDRMGRIAIGPDSAGADPGPAAYDRGGSRPTITDADIALGRIDTAHFAGGKVALDENRAMAAIESEVARSLGLETTLAAYGITEMVDETMANAARVHSVEQGHTAADHTVIAFGGAAPLHVTRFAEKLGIDRIVVPVDAGVGSAVGFLAAPVAYEVVRSHHMPLDDFDAGRANSLLDEMQSEALAVVESGAPGQALVERRGAFMRYTGQGHEVFVTLPDRRLAPSDRKTIENAYNEAYRTLFQRVIPQARIEVLTWALSVSTRETRGAVTASPAERTTPKPVTTRSIPDPEAASTMHVDVYWRADLPAGAYLAGPSIVAEAQTSTYIGRRFEGRVAPNGNLIIDRRKEPTG